MITYNSLLEEIKEVQTLAEIDKDLEWLRQIEKEILENLKKSNIERNSIQKEIYSMFCEYFKYNEDYKYDDDNFEIVSSKNMLCDIDRTTVLESLKVDKSKIIYTFSILKERGKLILYTKYKWYKQRGDI